MEAQTKATARAGAAAENEHDQGLGIHCITGRRRLPPFARRILEARRRGDYRGFTGTSADGKNPTFWLLIGTEAWSVAQHWTDRLAVVAAADEDPAVRDWSCLVGADPVLLVPCGAVRGDHLQRLVAACFRDGVRRALDISTGNRYVDASPRREIANVA